MLRCWSCRASLAPDHVIRDGLLRGRDPQSGGPYRIYNCPHCRKENRIEEIGESVLYSSPAKEIHILDWLFGWIEPLAPEDFVEIQEWHHRFGSERQAIFEAKGDHRYSGSWWSRWLKQIRTHTKLGDIDSTAGGGSTNTPRQEKSAKDLPAPHPYRILGLDQDASEEQIRARFRDLVRTHHPDKITATDPQEVEKASRRLQQLLDAYHKLMEERKDR